MLDSTEDSNLSEEELEKLRIELPSIIHELEIFYFKSIPLFH